MKCHKRGCEAYSAFSGGQFYCGLISANLCDRCRLALDKDFSLDRAAAMGAARRRFDVVLSVLAGGRGSGEEALAAADELTAFELREAKDVERWLDTPVEKPAETDGGP